MHLLQGMLNPQGMHPRDLLCLGQWCTLQLMWQSEAVAAFPLQTRFALQTRNRIEALGHGLHVGEGAFAKICWPTPPGLSRLL